MLAQVSVNGAAHVTFAHRAPPQNVTLVECCDFEPANLQALLCFLVSIIRSHRPALQLLSLAPLTTLLQWLLYNDYSLRGTVWLHTRTVDPYYFQPTPIQYIASADVMPAAAGGPESFPPMPMPFVSMPPMPPMAPIAMAPMPLMPSMALGPMPAPMFPPPHPTYPAATPPVTLLVCSPAL